MMNQQMLWNHSDMANIPTFDVGDRLRKSMRAAGFSAGQMADQLGVSTGSVGNWINGRAKPGGPVLTLWAQFTDVPRSWLETGETPPHTEDGDGVTS